MGREAGSSLPEEGGVSNITSRIRAIIGALGILACASPLAAQTHQHRGQMRFAAQWVERSQGAARQQMHWRRAAEWRMAGMGWHRGYAAGFGWRAFALRRPVGRRSAVIRFIGPRHGLHRRPWHRARVAWRYRVG
jgi:hypothetical protein